MTATASSARSRLLALKARLDAGAIDAAAYEEERRGIERELSDALLEAGSRSDVGTPADRPSRRLLGGLAAGVLAIAFAGYFLTGSPGLAGLAPSVGPTTAAMAGAPAPDGAASDSAAAGLQQIAAMVDTLAARMKDRPDDAEGWTMLARSYTVLGRFADSLPAYRRATELRPSDAGVLADYADATAASGGGLNQPAAAALVDRALAADPNHPKALALAGTLAYNRGDFAGAIVRWQKIADALPPESQLRQQVQASIAEAQERAGAPVATSRPASAVAPSGAAAADSTVSGTVTLAPAIAARAAPGDSVFVFARAAEGSRMPLAVLRARVADLPLTFKLDDSMAMAPIAKLSGAAKVIVGARVSKTGNATPQLGDLAGESAVVVPGATGLAISIDSVVGAR